MFRKMLIAALALVALMASPAAATYDFEVSPTVVQAGGTVSISGKDCPPNSPVDVKVTQRATGKVIYTASDTTDAAGEFSFSIKLPSDLAAGWYDIEARCCPADGAAPSERALQGTVEGDCVVFRASVQVKAAPAGNDGTGTGTIVRTGSDLNGLGLVGAGLLTVGGLVLLASKRRKTAEI